MTVIVGDDAVGARRTWPLLRGFAGYRPGWLAPDLLAGLTLAAIAIPEQMATARLAGLPPRLGFFAFIAGALAFALLGSTRRLSSGADSTITPIFAGSLALMAASGSPQYGALAAGLALMVGAIVLTAGWLKLGWIGNLLSIPVTTGFLAGIAAHIVVSQAPAALGAAAAAGALPHRVGTLVLAIPHANPAAVAMALGVIGLIALSHRLSPRLPGPLAAVALATLIAGALHLPAHGLSVLGAVAGGAPDFGWPGLDLDDLVRLAPLALLVALVVMAQTAATARAFPDSGEAPGIDRDFIGVGAGSLLAGLMGAFPVNASPPRSAVTAESGGRSPLAGLVAAVMLAGVLMWATGWLAAVPEAALAGVLMFVASRLVRLADIARIVRASPVEGVLILATAVAIIALPIASGVAVGVALSLAHGAWSSARVHLTALKRLPGTTVWWPPAPGRPAAGETEAGVVVLGFAAPLTFLNADAFRAAFLSMAQPPEGEIDLVILEAAGLVEIDYTGAEALRAVIDACRAAGQTFALARLESLAAQAGFARLGLTLLIGEDHIFESVAAALAALAPKRQPAPEPHQLLP